MKLQRVPEERARALLLELRVVAKETAERCLRMGSILQEMHDDKMHLELGYESWNKFCSHELKMTREQAGRFLAVASENRYAALWSVLLMGGLRPGEAFGLRWEDVDLEGGKLHIQHALTRRGVNGWRLVEPKTDSGQRVVVLVIDLFREASKPPIVKTE